MFTVALLSSDSRLTIEIQSWIRQMADKVRLECFRSVDELRDALDGKTPPPLGKDGKPDENYKRDLRTVLVDIDMISSRPIAWLQEVRKMVDERKPPDAVKAKMLVMAYEAGLHRADQLQSDPVDDLILKPLDRTLLLQKIEFMVADETRVNPSFLFRQKTQLTIEVGKDIVIDEISDFAISMRNPGPLSEGLYAMIHCDVFGAKGQRRVLGRVFESAKHPVREGEYVVRFSFFGITADQLANVKKFVRAQQTTIRKGQPNAPKAKPPAAAAGALFQKMRRVAVIDMDPEILNEVKSAVETGFKSVNVRPIASYTRLLADLKKFMPEGQKPTTTPAQQAQVFASKPAATGIPLDSAFPGGRKLTVIVRGGSYELLRFDPHLLKHDIVLGRPSTDWLQTPSAFYNSIDREDRELFEEFVACVESGASGKTAFRLIDSAGRTSYIEAVGTQEKSGAADGISLIRVEMNEIDINKYRELATPSAGAGAASNNPNFFKFDAILVDASFVKPDPAKWYERLVETLRAANILGADEQPPKVLVMADPKSRVRPEDFRLKGITDFAYKPLDRRLIVQKMQAFMPMLQLTRDPEFSAYVPCEINAKLGKEVHMNELAEFGLAITQPSPFKERIFMRFYSRLFGDEGGWIAGRCHTCEKGNDDTYKCNFMFFGPTDDLLQRIRRWIREDYVAKKEGEAKRA